MNPPPALAPEEYARRFTARRELCHRAVIRDGYDEPCNDAAASLAHDPESGFYPACDRHRLHGPVALTLHARPELATLGVGAALAGMAVACA